MAVPAIGKPLYYGNNFSFTRKAVVLSQHLQHVCSNILGAAHDLCQSQTSYISNSVIISSNINPALQHRSISLPPQAIANYNDSRWYLFETLGKAIFKYICLMKLAQ